MGSKGDWVGSAIYLILSIAVGIAMVWLGRALMH
jgi:fluoride ion exporter CrcB/FEX